MSDEEIQKLLAEAYLSEESPPLTDEDVNLILSLPAEEGPLEELERARGEFAAKILKREYKTPQRRVKPGITFGEWLQSMRESAGISHKAVAARLETDETLVHDLESPESHPWNFSLGVIAHVMILFRIHFNAIKSLGLHVPAKTRPLPHGISDSVTDGPSSSPVLMNQWLQDLKKVLKSLGADELIT
jgi:transcriptional regulator with XRE-family HTH domain